MEEMDPHLQAMARAHRTDGDWQPEFKTGLQAAVMLIEKHLPGWWWSIGSCSVSAHASIGPDLNGVDAALLEHKQFDEGFHADLARPSTCGQALMACIEQAEAAKKALAPAKGEAG